MGRTCSLSGRKSPVLWEKIAITDEGGLIRKNIHESVKLQIVECTLDLGIKELRNQIIEYCRAGHAVKIKGLGIWTPTIGLDSKLSIQYWPDPAISYGINIPGMFTGTILNREYIGKTGDDLIAKWNEDNPEDPVLIN